MYKYAKFPQQFPTDNHSIVAIPGESTRSHLTDDLQKTNGLQTETFSYPYGSFALNPSQLTIHDDKSEYDDFEIATNLVALTQIQPQPKIINQNKEVVSAVGPRLSQMDIFHNPYLKSGDENCVNLAKGTASYPKTIPVTRFGEPENLTSLIVFTANEAEKMNDQTININYNRYYFDRKEASTIQ
jgi:hypothetical protein